MNPPGITVTHRFNGTAVLNNLSLGVHAGEIFGLHGHNGAGKTNSVRLLDGVIEPDSG